MGRVTIDAQALPPVSFSRAPDAEDLGHPNKPAVRVSTPAAAKSGGEGIASILSLRPKPSLQGGRGRAFQGGQEVLPRVAMTPPMGAIREDVTQPAPGITSRDPDVEARFLLGQ